MESDGERSCWICLSSEGELVNPCKCPQDHVCHKRCLARWQLQSAGKSEEHRCRFCHAVYPSWKESLTPPHLKPAIPVVSVHYNGICYRLRVKPGPEGLASFQHQLQKITGLPVLDCMQITFQCRAPDTAQELSFKGISAFDAAIHCAAISAAERLATQKPCTSNRLPNPLSINQQGSEGTTSGDSSPGQTSTSRANDSSNNARPHRHSTGGEALQMTATRSLAIQSGNPSAADPVPRMSMDSHTLHRVASQVLIDDTVQAAPLSRSSSSKHLQRLRRFREFLRGLFA